MNQSRQYAYPTGLAIILGSARDRGNCSSEGRKVTEGVKQKLQQELNDLDEELHVHLPREIKRAKEFGDLRENAEYHAALARQQYVQARIQQLRQRLSELSSIDLSKIPRDRAADGSTPVLHHSQRDEEVVAPLVTPQSTTR